MSSDNDLPEDDLDLDLDFGDDFPSMDGEETKDDRSTIDIVKTSFLDGVEEKSSDSSFMSNAIKKLLPKGYGDSLEALDALSTKASKTYEATASELRPAITSFKRSASLHLPKIEKILPDKVTKRLEKFLETEEDRVNRVASEAELREASITTELGNIFKIQEEGRREERVEDTLNSVIRDNKEDQRHNVNVDYLEAIYTTLRKNVSYQDDITSVYQRKDLELQLRQLFAARDLLELSKASYLDITTSLKAIAKNTSLPESVKERQSETIRQMSRERLAGRALGLMDTQIDNIFGGTIANIESKLTEFTSAAKDGLTMGADMLQTAAEMEQMQADLGMKDERSGLQKALGLGANMGGAQAVELLTARLAQPIRDLLNKNDTIAAVSNTLEYANGNAGEMLNEYFKGDQANPFENETLANMYSTIMGGIGSLVNTQSGNNETVLHNYKRDALESVSYDVAARRSIVEIIPDYLSRILQQVELVNGEQTERLTFNIEKEKLTTISEATADAKEALFAQRNLDSIGQDTANAVETIIGEGVDLSDEARKGLADQILEDISKREGLNPYRYTDKENGFNTVEDESVRDELIEFFRSKYIADGDESINFLNRATTAEINKDAIAIKRASKHIPQYQDELNNYVATGNKDILRETGIVKGSDSGDVVNFDRVSEIIKESVYSEMGMGTKPTATVTNTEKLVEQVETKAVEIGKQSLDVTGDESLDLSQTHVQLMALWETGLTDLKGIMSKNTLDVDYFVSKMEPLITSATIDLAKVYKAHRIEMGDESILNLGEIIATDLNKVINQEIEEKPIEVTGIADVLNALNVISEQLDSGINVIGFSTVEESEGATKRKPKLLGKALGIGKNIGGGLLNGLMGYYKTIGKGYLMAGKGVVSAVTKTASIAKDKLFTAKAGEDIYVGGNTTPALTAIGIKTGQYIDKNTGKVITEMTDITGEVIDRDSNVVLSAEDYTKGLFNKYHEPLALKAAKFATTKPFEFLRSYYGLVGKGYLEIIKAPGKLLAQTDKFMNPIKDVYVRGENKPRLYKQLFLKGHYYSAKTGMSLEHLSDIDGDVLDENRDIVLSVEDIKKGLVDSDGNAIKLDGLMASLLRLSKSGVGGALTVGKKAIGALGSYYKTVFGLYGKGFKGLGKLLAGKFGGIGSGGSAEHVEMQANIVNLHVNSEGFKVFDGNEPSNESVPKPGETKDDMSFEEVLNESTEDQTTKLTDVQKDSTKQLVSAISKISGSLNKTKEKKVSGDDDGDGLRDGGWREQRKEKAQRLKEQAKNKLGAGLALAKGKLGFKGKGKSTDKGEEGGGILDTILGVGGGMLGSKVLGKVGGGAMRALGGTAMRALGMGGASALGGAAAAGTGAGIGSAMLGGLGSLATGATALGGTAVSAIGSTALGASALAGLSTLGSVLLGPVGLGIAATVGAWKLGNFIADRLDAEPLEALRFAHMGLDPEEDSLAGIRQLEDVYEDWIKYDDKGNAYFKDVDHAEAIEEVGGKFDVDEDDPRSVAYFIRWLSQTFEPAYLAHATAMHRIDEDIDVDDVDDEMDDEDKAKFAYSLNQKMSENGFRRLSPFRGRIAPDNVSEYLNKIEGINEVRDEAIEKTKEEGKPVPLPTSEKNGEKKDDVIKPSTLAPDTKPETLERRVNSTKDLTIATTLTAAAKTNVAPLLDKPKNTKVSNQLPGNKVSKGISDEGSIWSKLFNVAKVVTPVGILGGTISQLGDSLDHVDVEGTLKAYKAGIKEYTGDPSSLLGGMVKGLPFGGLVSNVFSDTKDGIESGSQVSKDIISGLTNMLPMGQSIKSLFSSIGDSEEVEDTRITDMANEVAEVLPESNNISSSFFDELTTNFTNVIKPLSPSISLLEAGTDMLSGMLSGDDKTEKDKRSERLIAKREATIASQARKVQDVQTGHLKDMEMILKKSLSTQVSMDQTLKVIANSIKEGNASKVNVIKEIEYRPSPETKQTGKTKSSGKIPPAPISMRRAHS